MYTPRQLSIKSTLAVLPLLTACGLLTSGQSFDKMLKVTVPEEVPHVQVREFRDSLEPRKNLVILDGRTREEFEVSHMKNAIWVGEKQVPDSLIEQLNRADTVVVYCSVGARSAKITENLREKGFDRSYNLYGGIFGYIREGGNVINSRGDTVNKVHPYNKIWGQWVSGAEKSYE